MDNFETYNRVNNLESPWVHSCFSALHLILISAILAFLLLAYLDVWPWQTSVLATTTAAVMSLILKFYDIKRSRRCHQCRSKIGYVDRELLLGDKYLAMRGSKHGDCFYTQCRWGNRPFITRWAKISHRARACHHCRLSEVGHYQYFEPFSAEQLTQLQNQQHEQTPKA